MFITSLQIIPDSLSTLLQYLSHLRQEFNANGQDFLCYLDLSSSILLYQLSGFKLLFLYYQVEAKVQMLEMLVCLGVMNKN